MASNAQENERVRKAISQALFDLLQEKEFSEVTVTDIVTRANVARASYYRNFKSKEDVLRKAMQVIQDMVLDDIVLSEETMDMDRATRIETLEKTLTIFLTFKASFLMLYRTGFSDLMQDFLNEYSETLFGGMSQQSVAKYGIYFASGGIYNVLMTWLKNGAVESPHVIAEFCVDAMDGELTRRNQ